MNPKTNEIPELKELWQRIVVSYRANDLEELEEAEILVNKFLVDHHLDGNEIKNTGYRHKDRKIKRADSEDQRDESLPISIPSAGSGSGSKQEAGVTKRTGRIYRVYEQELDQLLEQMMKNGVSFSMADELEINKGGVVSLIDNHELGEILKPLVREIYFV